MTRNAFLIAPQTTRSTHDQLAELVATTLARLRGARPRIHAITGPVALNLTTNGLLALGANPSLTVNEEECEEFVLSSEALLLNLGMLDRDRFAAIPLSAEIASRAGKPFVVDPVFADRSPRRRALARQILAHGPRIVKLNAAEAEAFSRFVPENAAVIVTGAVDRIRLGKREARLANGHPILGQVSATGCLLGAILAAMTAVEEDPFLAGIAGVTTLNIAAEIAVERSAGPGTFAVHLIDALAALDVEMIHPRLKVEFLREGEA